MDKEYTSLELSIKLEALGLSPKDTKDTIEESLWSKGEVVRHVGKDTYIINRLGFAGKSDCTYILWKR